MSGRYKVQLSAQSEKVLKKLDPPLRNRILGVILQLESNPYPPASLKFVVREAFRIRTSDYRIIYEVNDGSLVILVVSVGHRREIYRGRP